MPGANLFDDDAARRIRESVRRTEQDLVGPDRTARRIARRRHEPDEIYFVELKSVLIEGSNDGAVGHLLVRKEEAFERLDVTHPNYEVSVRDRPPVGESGGQIRGMFRGMAFGYETNSLTANRVTVTGAGASRGDVLAVVRTIDRDDWTDPFRYHAVSPGAVHLRGTAVEDAAAGAITLRVDVTFTSPYATDGRVVRLWTVRAVCAVEAGAEVLLSWDSATCRWNAIPACPDDQTLGCGLKIDDDGNLAIDRDAILGTGLIAEGECGIAVGPPTDPDDPENPPGGGGGSGPCGCGLPPGVECSPLKCCPEDDPGLTVTDCEEFATAPEEYYVEVPSLTCVPDCATGNEPDETSGLPPRRVTLTYQAGTCTWLSEVFDCGDGVEWQWELVPSLDGRSWLRLYKDAVWFLQWQTNDAWCPRCDNDVEIYCPPDECTDLTERLCVKPVCANCADGICYTVDNPTDWDGVSSEEFIWSGASGNTGVGVTDAAEGRPTPPSRRITLVYGHLAGEADGAAVVETFPGIGFDPATCAVDLDGVCGIELSVKVQSDDSVGDRGVRVGIAIKQGSDSFVATIGSARLVDGWKTFAVNRLLAADFDKVTATGMDDSVHPDWTAATGTAMTFGVCLWQEDGTVDDAFGDAITVVANWDILRLCLESEPCTGDPASYVCPDAVTIAACQELGTTVVRNIPFTNDGDTPFTLVSVLGGNALQTACGGTAVTVDIVGPPQFLGPLPPGETRNIVITVERGLPLECSGTLTIVTDLPGADAVCVVPVDIVILAEDECDVGGACTGTLDDEFPEATYADNTPLEGNDPVPVNDANCVWGPVWSQMMDMTDGTLSGTTANLKFVYNTDTARPAIGGDPTDAVTGSYPSRKLIGQELEGFAAEFGTSYMLSVGLNRGVGGINEERGAAIVLYTAEDHHFSVQWDRLDHKLRLVSWDGNGNKTEHETWTDGGASANVWVGIWRLGSLVKVAARTSPPTGDLHNATMWDDPEAGGNGHIFADVRIPNGHSKLAIAVFTATAPFAFPGAYVFHLCCNGQQGTAPKWEA